MPYKNTLVINGHDIVVIKKNIKNMYLRVHPSGSHITISAPNHISNETIRMFIHSKFDWIKKKSEKLQQQALLAPQEYLDSESHYVWGKKYALSVRENITPASIELIDDTMQLNIKANASFETKKQLVNSWARKQLRLQARPLIDKWCPILCVSIKMLYVRQMKSCWGSCNSSQKTIRLNTELIKNPVKCLEYVVVHELVHLLEPSHNKNFYTLMTEFLPDWKQRKQLLNSFPLSS